MQRDYRKILDELRVRVEGVNALYGGPLTDESFEQMDNHLHHILNNLGCDVYECWANTRPVRYGDWGVEPSTAHEVILKELENLKESSKSPTVTKKLADLLVLLLKTKDVVRDAPSAGWP